MAQNFNLEVTSQEVTLLLRALKMADQIKSALDLNQNGEFGSLSDAIIAQVSEQRHEAADRKAFQYRNKSN